MIPGKLRLGGGGSGGIICEAFVVFIASVFCLKSFKIIIQVPAFVRRNVPRSATNRLIAQLGVSLHSFRRLADGSPSQCALLLL